MHYKTFNLAKRNNKFFDPCTLKLIIAFLSTPVPSIFSTIPFPNLACSTSVPTIRSTTSILFDGSDDVITAAAHPDLTLGVGDFTVEAWVYPDDRSGDMGIFGTCNTGAGRKGIRLYQQFEMIFIKCLKFISTYI